ncbi:hypothetical protein C8K30_103249 [Promicromonospora sp. AC04]|uniref:hypothetical protein n=1 Tax=Promicromonospora sp. AC04 TaxID=2135723 RepID=UPI000D42FED5|nr:hypothetical protein [Promicromonospora sp. AC04]PUB28825.1 hypothetical protein C8K30_103249 [Promicromonospora sp. AC04]
MPTSIHLRLLLSARRICLSALTSGLALGLAVTTVGAAPAQATPAASNTAPAALTEALDPAFVQEGMPSPHGGQVVMWGDREWAYQPAMDVVPEALPDGVQATAISSYNSELLVLRSDGLVDGYDSAGMLDPSAPPAGTSYTAISASAGRLLRSDGVVVDTSGNVVLTPPTGTVYTAVSGYDALRSDGVIAPLSGDGARCAAGRRPGAGLRYTAISSFPDYPLWAALRSDGALVYCAKSGETVVAKPSAGTRFVGVDQSEDEILAATSDGRIVAIMGAQPPAVPDGRSVVSLAAMGAGQGAAVLDDGTILRWGLSGEDGELPALPAERGTYSAVEHGAYNSHHWAIMVGDPIPVEVTADVAEPADRPLRVTDDLNVDLTIRTADGTAAFGHISVRTIDPEGIEDRSPRRSTLTGAARIAVNTFLEPGDGVGTWDVSAVFTGSPFATTTATTSADVAEPSPVRIVTSGLTTWRQTANEGTLCFDVESVDGSPLWGRGFSMSVAEDSTKSISGGFSGRECVNNLSLEPRTWTVAFGYSGWGAIDRGDWSGTVVVQEPAVSTLRVDLPTTWRYGQIPDRIPFTVDAEELSAQGVVRLSLNGRYATGATVEDGTGAFETWAEPVPGTHHYLFEYEGGFGALPSSYEQTVTVLPALFTTAAPTVSGTAKVGAALTAERGAWAPEPIGVQHVWKADGVVIKDATSSVLTVPASAAGKKITVTVIGDRQYYTTASATSAPTAVVAPGTFTAPRPTITGTVKVGRTLTASRGTWSPAPSSVKYVWKANGVPISTRTTSTFVVPASAKGKRLTVTVIGSRTGYTTKTVASAATATVASGTFTAPRPTITGTTRVGSTLTANRGSWSPAPSSDTYVWKADGVTIATRTSNRFVIPSRARGKQLTVTVIGSRTGYTTKSVTSFRTATIR